MQRFALFLLLGAPLLAGHLTVQGQGKIQKVPDTIQLQVNLQSEHTNASSALAAVDAKAAQLVEALTGLGIAEEDMATTGINLYPNKEWNNGMIVRSFFVASHQLSITVRQMSSIGAVLDQITKLPGENSFSIQLALADREAAEQEALRLAMGDARSKAQILAGAESLGLQAVESIQYGGTAYPAPQPYDSFRADVASTTIVPGEMTIQAMVTVTYQIQ